MKQLRTFAITTGIISVYLLVITSAFSKPRTPQPPWPEATLRIYGFDSQFQRGPWKDIAINEETSVTDGWSGHTLVREGFVALSPVVIPVDVESKRPNFKMDGGAIRFWIAPNWSTADEKLGGKGPGHLARLVELVSLDASKPAVKWSLCVNESGDTIYLAGEGKTGTSIYLKAPVQFEANDWRMITLGYSTTNTALWIDNELVAKGEPLPKSDWWETKNLGLVVGSDVYGSSDCVAEAQFDELVTLPRWPKKSDWHDLYFKATKRRTLLGTMGTKEEEQAKVTVLKSAGLLPEDYGTAAMMVSEGDEPVMAYSYAAGTLWLEITGVSNNLAHLIVHGSTADVAYEILSKESLTNTEWVGEQVIIGATGQDWTPTTAAVGTRTNELFFWARTLVDADGDGLPDWWELAHALDPNNPDTGNTGVSDGYKDGDNDGWTNLQEYQNGTSPGLSDTPATLSGFTIFSDPTGTHAKLAWLPASGPVTGYTIERGSDSTLVSVSSSTRSYVDSQTILPTGFYNDWAIPVYRIRAEYSGNSSVWSDWRNVADLNPPVAQFISGQDRLASVGVSAIPNSASVVRVGALEYNSGSGGYVSIAHVDLAPNQFTNGVAILPASLVQVFSTNNWREYAQFILTNGAVSARNNINYDSRPVDIFWDGRAQLKDNLRFLLRMPGLYEGFNFVLRTTPGVWYWSNPTYTDTYVYSSFYKIRDYWDFDSSFNYVRFVFQEREIELPFNDNYKYSRFACAPTNLTASGRPRTGVFYNNGLELFLTNQFAFVPPVSGNTLPSLLSTNNSRWLCFASDFTPFVYSLMIANSQNDLGVTASTNSSGWLLTMAGTARNWFGLPYSSYLIARGSNASQIEALSPTHPVQSPGLDYNGFFYPEPAQPAFQLVDYYFTSVVSEAGLLTPAMPGYSDFEVTNTTPNLFVISADEANFTLAGYAKLAVTNGYPGIYGYLQQYFDKAYKTTNGVVTTNETGILSPYGEFFPTEPGRTALVTMPDLDTGARGTATVYVVKMELDMNHDGAIDRTFAGPDNSYASNPFRFWINNDNDASDYSTGYEINAPGSADSRDNEIKSQRDLEDFARLWISGIPPLPSGQGYSVTVSSSGPGIQLFPAYESTDGGIGYLTNTTVAANQVTSSSRFALGSISPGTNYLFPDGYFATYGRKHFLFEGASAGEGAVTLTIAQGTNVLMQTSVYMDLKDVKDMYEQGRAKNVTSGIPPSSLVSELAVDRTVSATANETQQIIVFVHGINNTEFDYQVSTETLFKRLYWSGYNGKVAGFRWPCAYLPFENTLNPFNYNKGEFYAYKSAKAFKDYLSYLTNRADLAGYSINILAHSQGNAVAGEALSTGAPFDNYILSQGAIPAHCFDGSAPTLQKLLNEETNKPTPYIANEGGYHICYTNLSGNVVNFFNTNDFALATGTYFGLEANWEENQKAQKPESFIGEHTYFFSVSTHFTYRQFLSQFTQATDLQEIRAMAARSRTKAVGAQGGLGGVIDGQVDLFTSFNFGETRPEHSAQFARPIQTVKGYFDQIFDILDTP